LVQVLSGKSTNKHYEGMLIFTLCKNAGPSKILNGVKLPSRNFVVGALAMVAVKPLIAPMKGTFCLGEPVFYR
jgi:hypothetical protein